MKREKLFRGKRKDNGEWIYGYFMKYPDGDCYISDISTADFGMYEVDPETVGQLVGIWNNETKVFEDDFVLFHLLSIAKDHAKILNESGVVKYTTNGTLVFGNYNAVHCKLVKVIDNVHDDSALLKKTENSPPF